MPITTVFDLFFRRLINTGSAFSSTNATAGYFQTNSIQTVSNTLTVNQAISHSYLNFPSNVQNPSGYKYITTRTGSTPTTMTNGALAVPWASPAADFLWNCTVPLLSHSFHQTTYTTASGNFNYTSSKWTIFLNSTASFFYDNPPSTQNPRTFGVPAYPITSSWHVVDGKFLSNKNIYPTGGHWHYCIRDTRLSAPSWTTPTYIGSNPDYNFNETVTKQLFATESITSLGGTPGNPFPDRSGEVGYEISFPTLKATSTSSLFGGYFDRGGGAGITQTLISQSYAEFAAGVSLTASNATIGFVSMSRAMRRRRLFFPTFVSASGTNNSQDYWFRQFTGYKSTDIFDEDGGIYNVQFTLKRYIGGNTPYSSSLVYYYDKFGNLLDIDPNPATVFFYRETNNYYPSPGSYLQVFISDVRTSLTSSTALVEGTPGWYPPSNNIVLIGNQYGTSPSMSFYDIETGYQLERFNINLIQYGFPAQLCFEPSGDTTLNRYFGCIIDDINICKIGVTTDTRFTKTQTVSIKTRETSTAIAASLGQGAFTFTFCCFVPGTMVTMEDYTTKKIEDIFVGDKILVYDTTTEKVKTDTVKDIIQVQREEIVTYTLADNTKIQATPDHPMYTLNKGWVSVDPQHTKQGYDINVQEVELGDCFLNDKGFGIPLVNKERVCGEPRKVYTLTTTNIHNYYANGFLAHNLPKGICPGTSIPGFGEDGGFLILPD